MNVRFHESDDPDAWLDDDGKHHPNRTSNTELAEQTVEQINSTKKLILTESKEGRLIENQNHLSQLILCFRLLTQL